MRIESELAKTEDKDKISEKTTKPRQTLPLTGGIDYPSSSYSSGQDTQSSPSQQSGHYMNKSMPTKRAYLPQVKKMQ
jgi:hypothetical protein